MKITDRYVFFPQWPDFFFGFPGKYIYNEFEVNLYTWDEVVGVYGVNSS